MAGFMGPIFGKVWEKRDVAQKLREDLHRIPELGWQEHKTLERVGNELADMGIEAESSGVGITARIGPAEGGPVVLRAECDGLPVQEVNDVPYKSTHDGFMHACGHDATTAGLVIGAGVIQEYHKKNGILVPIDVRIQRAEENALGGAEAMVRGKPMHPETKLAAGAHCWPDYHVGQFASREGLNQFSYLGVDIKLEGQGGHSARPHESSDLGLVTAELLVGMNKELRERHAGDAEPPIVAWTGIESVGEAANVMPQNGWLRATARFGSVEAHQNGREEIKEMVERKLREHKVRGTVDLSKNIPPVVNTAAAYQYSVGLIKKELGADAIKLFPGSTGGDDMAVYGTGVPGVRGAPELHYMQVGTSPRGSDPKTSPRLHANNFDMHPDTPAYMAGYFAGMGISGFTGPSGDGGRGRRLQLGK